MDHDNSITIQSFTNSFANFLQSGALLRHEGLWTLIVGPFKESVKANSSVVSMYWPDFYDLGKGQLVQGSAVFVLDDGGFYAVIENYLQKQVHDFSKPLSRAPWLEPSLVDFINTFESILAKIESNQIKKAVPVVFSRSAQTLNSQDLVQLLVALRKAPESLYVYGFWQNGEGVLGATPEVLFSFENFKLKTMALAGTLSKLENSPADELNLRFDRLLNDPKEISEHNFVVEDLKARLEKWGKIVISGPIVLDLPLLCHLKTDFEVSCQSIPEFIELIFDLHPTPALGVAPRAFGFKWLSEYPGQENRRGFGGPFAFIEKEKAICLVAIRNLQWTCKEVMIGSGCGIVEASQIEREWSELNQKRLSVKKILGLE